MFQKIKKIVMQRSRSKKMKHFYSLADIQSSVLDVGVSDNEHNNSINFFLKDFRFNDSQYTGLAIQPMKDIRKKYPNKKIIEYDGKIFPFKDNAFEWIFSNAVIEHVGNRNDQLLFLNEMLRVGKNIFFTTPNKWFPIESHTNIFFRHWFNKSFYKWCKMNQPDWNIDNLLLFGKKDLDRIMQESNATDYKIQKNKVLGWTMTFTIVGSTKK